MGRRQATLASRVQSYPASTAPPPSCLTVDQGAAIVMAGLKAKGVIPQSMLDPLGHFINEYITATTGKEDGITIVNAVKRVGTCLELGARFGMGGEKYK